MMQSVQTFDARALKVRFECCYSNTAIGNEKFSLKKVVKKVRVVQKNILEFPICSDCKRRYRNRLILSYLGGIAVFSILIFVMAVISIEVNVAWLTFVGLIILERGFQFIFGRYVIEPLRPVILSTEGRFSCHNKDYQRRYEELNYPIITEEEDSVI